MHKAGFNDGQALSKISHQMKCPMEGGWLLPREGGLLPKESFICTKAVVVTITVACSTDLSV